MSRDLDVYKVDPQKIKEIPTEEIEAFADFEGLAEKIREAGGSAEVILYEKINHTCLNPAYPEVFRNSLIEIARFYKKEFQLVNIDFKAIESDLDKRLDGMYPTTDIKTDQLIGTWVNKNETLELKKDGEGHFMNNKDNKVKNISYVINRSSIYVYEKDTKKHRTFYLRKNNKMIYESIEDNTRFKSRRIDYLKQ